MTCHKAVNSTTFNPRILTATTLVPHRYHAETVGGPLLSPPEIDGNRSKVPTGMTVLPGRYYTCTTPILRKRLKNDKNYLRDMKIVFVGFVLS